MLSHSSIEEKIRLGEVIVYYHFLGSSDKYTYHPKGLKLNLDDIEAEQSKFFRDRLSSDRLGITLGPIIKSHSNKTVKGRPNFRGRKGYTDIRETQGVFRLAPYETISIASNERIVLGSNTFCLIVPRITLGDAGILLNVAYIDAYWDGTLQMVITNGTPYFHRLSLLESIAQCLFFDLSEPVDSRFRSDFPSKSHHYGQSWGKVLEENAEAFPLRKVPEQNVISFANWLEKLKSIYDEHKIYFNVLGIVFIIISGFGTVSEFLAPIRDIPEMKKQIARINPYFEKTSEFNLPAIQQAVSELRAGTPISGISNILIEAGSKTGSTTVNISRRLSPSSVMLVDTQASNGRSNVSSKLENMSDGKAVYRITIDLDSPYSFSRKEEVKWVLIP